MEIIKKHLKELKLAGMVQTLEIRNEYAVKEQIDYLDFLNLLVEDEINNRKENSYKKRSNKTHLPAIKRLEDFDFTFQPKLNKKQIYDLAACRFIQNKENIVFMGPPGTGKTHLAIAIGLKALLAGYKVLFTSVSDMINVLNASKADNSYRIKLKYYLDPDLLILDELGFKKLSQHTVDDFFEIISKRYEVNSTIITSNKSFEEWGSIFFDPILATAIIDRLIHHCHLIQIKGESYRIKGQKITDEKA